MRRPVAEIAILVFVTCSVLGSITTDQNQIQDQPLRITKKPKALERDCHKFPVLVRLNVIFDKTSQISKVDIIESSGCKSFDKNAVKAAGKIEFKPAIKNGEAITLVKEVQYQYTLY